MKIQVGDVVTVLGFWTCIVTDVGWLKIRCRWAGDQVIEEWVWRWNVRRIPIREQWEARHR